MRVVLDSDVLIPMILSASKSRLLVRRLRDAGHEIVLSPQIYEEVAEKLHTKPSLRRWLGCTDDEVFQFLEELPDVCSATPGDLDATGSVPDDPDDDKIIAAAVEAMADYVVSEDRHLRSLGEYDGIPILNRDEMLAELDRIEADESSPSDDGEDRT